DIKGCFDNIDHSVLLTILREKIHDERFLTLIENLLKSGYLEQWNYRPTLSGTPQGGIISPLLANIYLDKLDKFVETSLIPANTRGKRRKASKEWKRVDNLLRRHPELDEETRQKLRKERGKLQATDPTDPNYRRLRYIRYADDFLLGFAG